MKLWPKIILGALATYGSACAIGALTDWRVGVLLVVFICGHNLDKHTEVKQ